MLGLTAIAQTPIASALVFIYVPPGPAADGGEYITTFIRRGRR